MNKEVIKTYFKEFTHWLNGGELLQATYFGDKPVTLWITPDIIDWKLDVKYIINDEYVEFRKALAEGKTVQCFRMMGGEWIDLGECNDVHQNFEGLLKNYRIKPDEPEFKVGEYVIDTEDSNAIKRMNETMLAHSTKHYKRWTLEEADDDEWVLAWDEDCNAYYPAPTLMTKRDRGDADFDCTIPYIGQTPKQLGLEK